MLQYFLEAGGLERVRIVPCAVHGNRADSGHVAFEIARDLHVHSRVLCLPGVQVRDRAPVPYRADRSVYQGSSLAAEHLDGIEDIWGEHPADDRAQQVPAPADGRLAAMEMRSCGCLGAIAAHQHDDHDHGVEQSGHQRLFRAGLDQRADFLHDQEAQLVQLPGGQPCESIVLQRFLPVILSVFDNHGSKRRGRCHVQGFLAFSANVHLCLWNCGELSAVPTAGVSERVNPGM